jgi:hypothetical protein
MKTNWTNVLIGALVITGFLYVLNPSMFMREGFSGGIAGGSGPANNTDTDALKPDTSDNTSLIVLGALGGLVILVLLIWFFFYRNK